MNTQRTEGVDGPVMVATAGNISVIQSPMGTYTLINHADDHIDRAPLKGQKAPTLHNFT